MALLSNHAKSTFLLALSTAVRMALGLYTVKITAVILGLSGTGVIGQFNNILLIITMIAGGGITAGIVKVSTIKDGIKEPSAPSIRSAYGYGLIISFFLMVIILVCKEFITKTLLPIDGSSQLITGLAFGQFLLFYISTITAILNGNQRQDVVAVCSLLSSIVGAASVTFGCLVYGLPGALWGILSGALFQLVFLYPSARKFLPKYIWRGSPRINIQDLKFWGHFSLLTGVTIVGMPLAQVFVRNALLAHSNWEQVGVWQAMVRLSDAYLQFALIFLSSIYYSSILKVRSLQESTLTITRYAKFLAPTMILAFSAMYLARNHIVNMIFTSHYRSVVDLFLPQMVGDTFKICSYLFSYAFLAQGRYKLCMAAELAQAMLFMAISLHLGVWHGAKGVSWSYALAYVTYFALTATVFFGLSRARHENINN